MHSASPLPLSLSPAPAQDGARRRLSQRLLELADAEAGLVFGLQQLSASLQDLRDDPAVGLDERGDQLAADVTTLSIALSEVSFPIPHAACA